MIARSFLHTALAAGLGLALAGCGPDKPAQAEPAKTENPAAAVPPAGPADTPVATLGAVSIGAQELAQWLAALPQPQRDSLKADRAALDRLIRGGLADKALVAQARAQGWTDKEEIQRAMQAAQEQVVLRSYLDSVSEPPQSYPGEDELRAAYEQARERLTQPAGYRISQIFIAAPFGEPDKVAAASRQIQDLARRAARGDFAALAREYSQDPASAAQGGDNGFATLAQLVPELRAVVAKLKPGEVSAPVQLPGGFHLLKLTELREARVADYEQVKPQLRAALRAGRQEQAAQAYLEGLLNAGTVSIDGKALSAAIGAGQ